MNPSLLRFRRLTPLLLALPALAALVAIAPARAAEPTVASTGQIDLSIEPPIPATATPLVLGPDQKPVLVEGKATPTSYLLFSFKPPVDTLFELRLFAPEGSVSMVVYRGTSSHPEPGAAPQDQTLMYMSSAAVGEELRILVRGRVAGETPFKLGAKVYPKESAAN